MKTIYETEIGIEKKIIILTTKTVEFLLSKNPDSLSLYMFYIKNAKIQKTNSIFNVESFGMKGLGWGRDRYRSAKKVLVEEKFIEDIIHKSKSGKIAGHYLKINYLFSEETTKETIGRLSHPVDSSIGGEKETNALSNKTINALNNVNKILVGSANEDILEDKEKPPYSFNSELNKLRDSTRKEFKIIALYWSIKGFVFHNKDQYQAALKRELRAAGLLKGYSGTQISQAIDYCKKNYDTWTLETIHKRISDLVNKK